MLKVLADGAVVNEELASARLTIPSYAQGAAVAPSGKLWISRSEIAWGSLERLDIAGGRIEQRYAVPGGVENISFDASGQLWAVSEAGARHIPWRYPFFPVIFRLDIECKGTVAFGVFMSEVEERLQRQLLQPLKTREHFLRCAFE